MAKIPPGDTFSTIDQLIENTKITDFPAFFDWLYKEAEELKTNRENFYRKLRNSNSAWIAFSRWALSLLGAAALLLTALAGIAALTGTQEGWLKDWQTRGLYWAFGIYAVMGAIALIERGTDLSASYFRHLTVTIAIRNLWSDFQLTVLKEYPSMLAATSDAGRTRAIELVTALCKDIDRLVAAEQTEWRAEFIESLKELDSVAKDGLAKSKSDLTAAIEKVTKAAEGIRQAAEQAKAALQPGDLNVTVQGDFDGDLVVLVDQAKRHQKPMMKKFAIRGITPGTREIEVKAMRGGKDINISEVVEVKPGVHAYAIVLP